MGNDKPYSNRTYAIAPLFPPNQRKQTFLPPRLATVYTQVLLFVYEAFCALNPRQVTAVAPLGETPRPRCLLYLGRPQDRTGSPILGDFETPDPPRIGGLGEQNDQYSVSPVQLPITHYQNELC